MNTKTDSPMNKTVWLDYLLSFVFASVGRAVRDWHFATKEGKPLPAKKWEAAALYSGLTGLAIVTVVTSWKPELQGSPLIICISLLAGIGAVDLADVIYSAFRQWARKAAGLEGKDDGEN